MAALELGPGLLSLPAGTAARLMARGFLRRVLEEAARVEIRVEEVAGAARAVEQEQEAVHDLRVALRRLRSWLRAWRPYLQDTVRRSSERRLQRLSRLAGVARDLEVQRIWLLGGGVRRSRGAKLGARRLERRIEAEYGRAIRDLATGLLRELGPVAARLDGELHVARKVPPGTESEPSMAVAMALAIEAQTKKLPRRLRRVRRVGQVTEAHAARIAVKRLRYLVDSLGRHSPHLRIVTGYLAGLQHHLGEFHDAQVLLDRLRPRGRRGAHPRLETPAGAAATVRARAALRALLRRRMSLEFRRVQRSVRGPGMARALAATEQVMRRLSRNA